MKKQNALKIIALEIAHVAAFYYGITYANGFATIAAIYSWYIVILFATLRFVLCDPVSSKGRELAATIVSLRRPWLWPFISIGQCALFAFLAVNNWPVTAIIVALRIVIGRSISNRALEITAKP